MVILLMNGLPHPLRDDLAQEVHRPSRCTEYSRSSLSMSQYKLRYILMSCLQLHRFCNNLPSLQPRIRQIWGELYFGARYFRFLPFMKGIMLVLETCKYFSPEINTIYPIRCRTCQSSTRGIWAINWGFKWPTSTAGMEEAQHLGC